MVSPCTTTCSDEQLPDAVLVRLPPPNSCGARVAPLSPTDTMEQCGGAVLQLGAAEAMGEAMGE